MKNIPQTRRTPIPRQRIETLSDLVFGLALSIGALSLIGKSPTSPADIRGEILGFGFSFIILISVWLRYTRIMSMLPLETVGTILVNIALLFLVSVEPYLFHLVNSVSALSALWDYASIIYAIDLACLMGILALFSHLIIKQRKLTSADLLAQERRGRNGFMLSASLFAVSTLPVFSWTFAGTPLRVMFWYASLVALWSLRIPIRKAKK